MPNHDWIYENGAEGYEELISKQRSLRDCVNAICPIKDLDIVDLGAGTGRLTGELAPEARSIMALDASDAMLAITGDKLRGKGLRNWGLMRADHRQLPLADECADLVVSGWSIGYLCSSLNPDWRENLRLIMGEMGRIMRAGGTAILFETMGTGHETPSPPSFLTDYYKALEEEYGFEHKWFRLDYQFESPEQAERLSRFFFGDEMGDGVAKRGESVLPECAGIWWKR